MKLINIGDSSVSERLFNVIYDLGERLCAANTIMLGEMHYSVVFAKYCKVGKCYLRHTVKM